MYCIVLMGRPCSGKSTIGRRYAERYGIDYISSGDIARKMSIDTLEQIHKGEMAPEDEMRKMVDKTIREQYNKGRSFILDGFPRFLDQHDWFSYNFDDLIGVIYVHVFATELRCRIRALERSRDDDEDIGRRMKIYDDITDEMIRNIHETDDVIMLGNNGGNYDCIELLVEYLHMEVDGRC